ncbi:MAG: LegC family aminotransferase [Desulfovibrionaceae bacterium]|nr:LegC family aminotransferase [Desulfovibrionaceae bacterium]
MSRDNVPARVVEALRLVLAEHKGPVGLHEPCLAGREWEYVKQCLDTGWVSSAGSFVERFESMLARYTGAARAVAVVNGTCGLTAALRLCGVGPNDEVIVPALTFAATANAVAHLGAVPHFADSSRQTLGLDPDKLAEHLDRIALPGPDGPRNKITGRRMAAVVPVHVFGHPVDLDPLAEVCARFDLVLVEDAAESLGSLYKGRHTGNWGRLAVISFNGNKTVTTGGGGMILTNDPELGERARHLTSTAKRPHKWEYYHDQPGYNYRMPNINAALGCAQMEQLAGFVERKRDLAERYRRALAEVPGVEFFVEPKFARSNYWLNAVILKDPGQRDPVLSQTNAAGFATRPVWTLMHRLPMYEKCPKMRLDTAEDLESRIVNLPSGAGL